MTTPGLQPVTFQNVGTITGFQISPRGAGVVNVYNGDLVNVLLVSPNPTPSLSNSVPIQPLTNATIDGSHEQYASAQTGTIAQLTVSPTTQLSPSPAQIAAQINLQGVSFTQPESVLATFSLSPGAWGTSILTFPTGSAGYEIELNSVVAANPFVTDLIITHLFNGSIVCREAMVVTNLPPTATGAPGNNQVVRIRGTLHGNQMSIGGQFAASTFFTTVMGAGFPTAGNAIMTVFALATPVNWNGPRITMDSYLQALSTQQPYADLLIADSAVIPVAGFIAGGFTYIGKASILAVSQGNFTVAPLLRGYTVTNGTAAAVALYRLPQVVGNIATAATPGSAYITEMVLPGFFWRTDIVNTSALAGTASLYITGTG